MMDVLGKLAEEYYKRGKSKEEILVELPEEIVHIESGEVVEEDIELIKKKRRYRPIVGEIGEGRFKSALEHLYETYLSLTKIAEVIKVHHVTLSEWFRRLGISYYVSPPRSYKYRVFGWEKIPEVEYHVPILLVETLDPSEQRYFIASCDTDGSLLIHHDKERGVYAPVFSFLQKLENRGVAERVGRALDITPRYYPKEKPKKVYVATEGVAVIKISKLQKEWGAKDCVRRTQAEKILSVFKHDFRLTEEEFEEALRRIGEIRE